MSTHLGHPLVTTSSQQDCPGTAQITEQNISSSKNSSQAVSGHSQSDYLSGA